MAARRSASSAVDNGGFDDGPPNSRLFIICGKNCNESEFREAFGRYGDVDDVRVVKDRQTGEPKGIVYVKFSKTSQAAEALEGLNGVTLDNHTTPLKVMVASNRSEGNRRESNETERLLRLFIVVPRDATEEKLREHFSEFGRVLDVLLVKDRKTGDNKGFAYIRYAKATHAALAFEECDKSYRPVFAEPKQSAQANRDRETGRDFGYERYGNGYSGRMPSWDRPSRSGRMDGDMGPVRPLLALPSDGFGSGTLYSVYVIAKSGLTQQQLWNLFDLVPGLESCDVHTMTLQFDDTRLCATVKYRSLQSANYAISKLNGFEYPPGYPLTVREPTTSDLAGRGGNYPSMSSTLLNPMGSSHIDKLTNALAQAQAIIKAAGLSSPLSAPICETQRDSNEFGGSDWYCSVRLPSPKPPAPLGTDSEERLFIVCTPTLLPKHILTDVFGRFEGLVNIYMLQGKNCGYVKYATKEAAESAMAILHGEDVAGVRLKVLQAEPRDDESGIHSKRQRTS